MGELLYVILVFFTLLNGFTYDDPTLDDADLLLAASSIAEADNGYVCFRKAVDSMYWPEEKESLIEDILEDKQQEDNFVPELMEEDKERPDMFVAELLERNKEALGNFDEILRRPAIQFTEYSDRVRLLKVHYKEWRKLTQLSSLKAMQLMKEGKEEAGFEEAMKIVRIGHKIEGAKGTIVHYFAGRALKVIGLERARQLLEETSLPAKRLVDYISELEALKSDEEGLADSLRGEYTQHCRLIQEFIMDAHPSTDRFFAKAAYPAERRGSYYFRPNKTRRLFYERYRIFIEDISLTWSERRTIQRPKFVEYSQFELTLSENSLGKNLFMIMMPGLDTAFLHKLQEDFLVSGTQLLFALKCYKMRNYKLPASLEELVPDYISSVPLDPFDGAPLRYSPEKKIVYSVGRDLVDKGGSEEGGGEDLCEPTLYIEF